MGSTAPWPTNTATPPSIDTAWRDMYQRFSADVRNHTLPPGLIKLQRWPDLGDVPDEFTGTIARICALLWSKPTASHLITHILGEDRSRTTLILQTLYALGYVEFAHHDDIAQAQTPASISAASPVINAEVRTSFIDKLRQQLLGRYFFDDTPIV